MTHEGPTRVTYPAHQSVRCGLCKYHELIGSFHVHCGQGGWREYACTHPCRWEPVTDANPEHAALRGRLQASSEVCNGRLIGRTEETPNWCPFTRPALELKREAEELNRMTIEATQQPKPRTPLFRGQRIRRP